MNKENMFIGRRTGCLLLFAAIVLFCSAACWRMNDFVLIDPDVFSRACAVVRFLSMLSGHGLENWQTQALVPGVSSAPLIMYGPYTGMLSVYMATACVFVFGPFAGTLAAFNLTQVILGVLFLLTVFVVLRRFFSLLISVLCVFFVATNWSYVYAVRNGFVREELLQVFCLWLGVLLLLRAYERTKTGSFYLAMFVFGLALWAKIVFLGFIAAALVSCFVVLGFGHGKKIFFLSPGKLCFGAGFLVLGAAPLIYFNCTSSFETLKILLGAVTGSQKSFYSGGWTWSNWDMISNMAVRVQDIKTYLLGTITGISVKNYFFLTLFCLSLAGLFAALFSKRKNHERTVLLTGLVFYALLFVLSCFLLGFYYPGHVLIMLPFCEFICAWGTAELCRFLPGRRIRFIFVGVIIFVWLGFQSRSACNFFYGIDADKFSGVLTQTQIESLVTVLEPDAEKTVLVASACNVWVLKFFSLETDILVLPHRGDSMTAVFNSLQQSKGKRFAFIDHAVDSDRAFVAELKKHGLIIKTETVLQTASSCRGRISLCELKKLSA